MEIKALEEVFDVYHDLNHSPPYVKVTGIKTPVEKWTTATTTLLFILPQNYPTTQPKMYIKENLKPRDGITAEHVLLASEKMRNVVIGGPWDWFCVHRLNWDERRHTMVTLTGMFKEWLKSPDIDNPWVSVVGA